MIDPIGTRFSENALDPLDQDVFPRFRLLFQRQRALSRDLPPRSTGSALVAEILPPFRAYQVPRRCERGSGRLLTDVPWHHGPAARSQGRAIASRA